MERLYREIRRYKWLLLSFIFRVVVLYISVDYSNYVYLTQACPTAIIDFSIMSIILIVEIIFIVHNLIDYLNLDKLVLIRISKIDYLLIIIKKIISSVISLTIVGCLISMIAGEIVGYLFFLDRIYLVLISLFSSFIFVKYKESFGCILIYLLMVLVRQI